MSKEKLYKKGDIWDTGTRVKAKDNSSFAYWNKYPMTIVGFRWTESGGIDYKIRAWRQNLHWVSGDELEKLADANFCSGCMKLIQCTNCGSACCV